MADKTIPAIQNLRGNIGIGTASPSCKLDVAGDKILLTKSSNDAFIECATAGAGAWFNANSTNQQYQGYKVGNNWFMGQYASNDFVIKNGLQANGTAVLTIQDTTDNVGIGTTSPAAKLHIDVTTEDNQPALRISKVSDQNENALEVYHGTNSAQRGIADFTNADGSVLYVRGDGNVGIGTTSPSAKLHVVGGDIRTENRAFFAGRRSASEPSFSFHDDSDTGMFNIASNILAFATSGSERVRIASDGLVTFAGTGGGALTIGSHIDLGDNQQVRLGASDDLTLYHEPSGENSYIDNSTGDLYIRNNSNDSVIIGHNANKGLMYVPDGRVELRFNDSKTFETIADGAKVTGSLGVNTTPHTNQQFHIVASATDTTGLEFSASQFSNETRILSYDRGSGGGYRPLRLQSSHLKVEIAGVQKFAVDASGNTIIAGDLTVNGTTTTLNSTTLQIDDKNIELGTVATPSDTTADGGGITLKGASDYTIRWADGTNSWHFNQGITVGANGTGHDVVFYGDTSDRYMTWDQSADRLNLRDHVELTLGTHNDLKLFHDNVRGRIAYTGANELQISGGSTVAIGFNDGTGAYGETGMTLTKDGAVKIRHDNSQKFTTDAGGITVTGKMTSDSIATGYANSLEMFASGVHNYISSQSSGSNLYIRNTGGGQILIRPKTGEDGIKLIPDGAVQLYHDNALKLTTTAGGADVSGTFGTGHINLDGELNFTTNGSKYIDVYTLANSNSFNIRHHNPSGNLYEMAFQSQANGATTLYHDGNAKFNTSATGATITGNLVMGGGQVKFANGGHVMLGDSNDLRLYHNGNSYIAHDTEGDFFIQQNLADKDLVLQCDDGSGGTTDYFRLDGSDAMMKAHRQLRFLDNVKATFGNSDDLDIYHDSSNNNNYIQANNGRNLLIESNGLSLRSQAGENMITATANGAVSLYHDNTTRLGTTSAGVSVTGNLSASSLTVNGSPQAGEVRFSATGINSSTYTTLCTVAGDNLASIIDMTITGTSSNVVLNSSFEILVNHYQDIHVKSVSGDYSEVTLRITSDNNEDFSIEAKHNGSTTTTIEVCIFPRAGETITPTSTDPNYTGREYEHTATEGFRFGGTDGGTESSNLIVDGRIGIGTTSPTDTLEVQNNVGNPMLHLRPNAVSTALNPVILYRNSLTGSANYMLCEGTSTYFGTHHGGVPTDKSEMIRILPSSSDAPSLRIGDAGSAGANLQIGGNIKLLNNGDSYITGGDVGIGTTSPDSPLELEVATAGSTQTRLAHFDHNPTGNTGSGFLRLSSGSNNASSLHIEQVSSGGGSLYGTYSDTNFINNGTQTSGAYNNINFVTNEAIRMTIGGGSQAGKVGIGTTTPSRTLHVVDSAGPTIKFERSSNSNLEFQFGTTNASILGAGEIQFRANGATSNSFIINHTQIQSNAKLLVNTNSGIDVHTSDTGTIIQSGNSSATSTPDQFFINHSAANVDMGNNRGNIKITKGILNPMFSDQGGGLGLEAMRWSYYPASSDYYLSLATEVPASGVVRYHWNMKNNGTAYDDVMVFDRGNVQIGGTDLTAKLSIRDDGSLTQDIVHIKGGGSSGNFDMLKVEANNGDDIFRVNAQTYHVLMPDSDTKVGIGTTSPQKALEISAAGTSGGGVMRLTSTGETSAGDAVGKIEFYNSDTTDHTAGVMASIKAIAGPSGGEGHLQFLTDMPSEGAEANQVALHLHSNANVGIGTTSPATKLQIDEYTVGSNGSQSVTGTASIFTNSGSDGLYLGVKNASYPNRGYSFKVTSNGVNSDFTIREHGLTGDRFTIQTGGNVGLGTTSPTAKLDVRGGVFISGNHTDTGGQLNVWCDSNGYGNLAVYNFCIKTGANNSRTNPFFISHIGSVGIGTTSINTGIKLQVAGGIYATTGYVYAKFIRADYFSSGQNLELQSGGSGKVQLRTSNNVQLEADNDGCTRLSHVGSTTGGKFLVRTYSENDYLSVFSTEYSSGALCMGYGAAGKYNAAGFVSTYDNFSGHKTILKINHNGINVLTTGSAATDTVGADLSMAERFRVEVGKSYFNNGPVGIGTTSPSTPLHIDHTGDKAITIESDGDTDSNFIFMKTSASTAQVYIGHETGTAGANFSGTLAGFAVFGNISSGMGTQFLTGGGNQHVKMTIRHSGQVGIGVTNPNSYYFSNLVVGDTTSGDHGITIRSSNAAKGVLAFADSDSGTGRYSGYIAYNHSTNDMEFYTLAGNFAMMIDDAQQVGIGTTSPNYLLDVEKSGAAMRVYNTDNNGQTDLHLRTAGTTGSSRIFFGDTAVSDIGSIIYRHNGNTLAFQTNGSERMRITGGSDGYVGIGTTSPQQELDVDGVIKQKVYTLSSLPSASSSTIGARAFISDSAVQYNSSNIGQQAAYGGGSYFVPVYSDGSYWYIG